MLFHKNRRVHLCYEDAYYKVLRKNILKKYKLKIQIVRDKVRTRQYEISIGKFYDKNSIGIRDNMKFVRIESLQF